MNVYHLHDQNEPEGQWVKFQTSNGLKTLMSSAGHASFFAANPRIAVERHEEYSPKGSKARLADMTRVGALPYPVFSERARAVFGPHLEGLGQWVPLDFDEAPYWLFWLTDTRDVLDVAASGIRYFSDGSGILEIEQPTFRAEAVEGLFMWKLPQRPGSLICVTDTALDLVREHRLTGFWFELLWSSEHGARPGNMKDWLKPRLTGLEAEPFDYDGFWAAHRQPRVSAV